MESGDLIIIDEFTSLVDRATAKGMSKGISKWCRSHNKKLTWGATPLQFSEIPEVFRSARTQRARLKLIIATIHNDIFSFMKPDFIRSTRYSQFISYENVPIDIYYKMGSYSDWKIFSKYHYLSSELFTASTITLAFVNKEPVGFIAISFQMKHGRRVHRLVVFPEWQGLGIGTRLLEHVAAIENNNNNRVYIKTSHPAIGNYLQMSPKWEPTTYNLKKNYNHPWYDGIRHTPSWCYMYKGSVPSTNKLILNIINPLIISVANPQEKEIMSPKNTTESNPSNCLLDVSKIPKWDCLIRKGEIFNQNNKFVYKRKNYQNQYFDSIEDAYNAQYISSLESGVNLYKISDDNVIIKIKDKENSTGFSYAKINKSFLEIVKGKTWHIRYLKSGPRARGKIDGKSVYLDEICNIDRKLGGIIFKTDPSVFTS